MSKPELDKSEITEPDLMELRVQKELIDWLMSLNAEELLELRQTVDEVMLEMAREIYNNQRREYESNLL